MMVDTLIREFDIERDYAQALALWERSGPGVHVSSLSDSRAEIAKKLARDADLFLVAEHGGAVAGTVIGGFDGRRGMVYHLAVEARLRRLGIGQALMAELERRLRRKGCRKYYLLVGPNLQAAIAFYEQFGFASMPFLIMGKEIAEEA
jgi:ribosomal protein S18 acetylase RimI-like enzyme